MMAKFFSWAKTNFGKILARGGCEVKGKNGPWGCFSENHQKTNRKNTQFDIISPIRYFKYPIWESISNRGFVL